MDLPSWEYLKKRLLKEGKGVTKNGNYCDVKKGNSYEEMVRDACDGFKCRLMFKS